ncbi:protein hunchback-like [Belonocnema kinseyi]|uniref:protein hunchback-like n=1 Tax=Belonocnema kinseyi TaxID=2817044 RepID=UPI00143DDABE|nr:protein hunchback-like [Belonocnema kinseyi]
MTNQSGGTGNLYIVHGFIGEFQFLSRDASRSRSKLNPRTFKCKTCTYTTTIKDDFWEHLRIHIKPEKIRACPMCNFVTQHKQQHEYHIRNHMGLKPFKCDKCSYSCVTKSMLNTHMKSHSSVFQYNCADCDYATKYLYALRNHLRKLQHKLGKVLNPDGTINPQPFKRGRKTKNTEVDSPHVAQNTTNRKLRMIYPKMMSSEVIPGQISPWISAMSPISPMGNPVNVGAINNTLGMNRINFLPYNVTYFINTMAVNENAINSGQIPSESPLNLKIPEGNCVQGKNKDIIRVPDIMKHRVPNYEVYHADEDVAPLDLSMSSQAFHGS